MSDFTGKDFTALFAAQRALDQQSSPAFDRVAPVATPESTRARRDRPRRRAVLVALAAAAVLIAAAILVSRSRRPVAPPITATDITHWSPPTDVLLRMSRDALRAPDLGTSSLITPSGN